MKKTALFLVAALLLLPTLATADEAMFKGKCVPCHGADGKKNPKVDLTGDKVQGKADADLVKFLTSHPIHKSKVASEDNAKSVIKYIRTLKK